MGAIDHSQQGLLWIGAREHERRVEDASVSHGDATDAVLDDVDPGNTGVGLDRGSEGDRTSCQCFGDRPHAPARKGELTHPAVVLTDRVVAVHVGPAGRPGPAPHAHHRGEHEEALENVALEVSVDQVKAAQGEELGEELFFSGVDERRDYLVE